MKQHPFYEPVEVAIIELQLMEEYIVIVEIYFLLELLPNSTVELFNANHIFLAVLDREHTLQYRQLGLLHCDRLLLHLFIHQHIGVLGA